MDYQIKELEAKDSPQLKDFLYEAIYVPKGETPPPRSIVEHPQLRHYYEGFGTQRGDYAYAAEAGGQLVGIVWTRIIDDYGHIADDIPSLAIAVLPAFRGRGIGRALMDALLIRLKAEGYAAVSLSVQKENAAMHLYERVGFCIYQDNRDECVMWKKLNKNSD